MRLFPPPSPALPQFKRLLIRGLFPASASIHLSLSHLVETPEGRAVLISPSRATWTDALKHLDDAWLETHGRDAATALLSSRAHMLYPPTLAHLRLCLAMLRTAGTHPHIPAHTKLMLDTPPTLIIMHSLSSYFGSEPAHTASSYVAVVIELLGAVQSIEASSSSSVAVAVFDTALENLRLPLVTPFSLPMDLQQTPLGEGEEEEPPEELFPDIGTVEVASVVEKYFQWSGVVKRGTHRDNVQEGDARDEFPVRTLCIRQIDDLPGDPSSEVLWKWRQTTDVETAEEGTAFAFVT